MLNKTNKLVQKRFITIIILLLISFIFIACPDPPVEDNSDTTIMLEEISTGYTDTQLRISVIDTTDEWTFLLTRNNLPILTQTVSQKDTIIYDNGLTPTTTYNYRAFWMENGERKSSSDLLTVSTGDTTSHNFTWEIDSIGFQISYFNDVAIVNEDNIWVVGYIEVPDSNAVSGHATYNGAHWDGNEWELLGLHTNAAVLNSIHYFNENDIWALGSYPIHWDGTEWTLYHLTNMGIMPAGISGEMWGSSPNDVYFVGAHGSIVHYDGSSFNVLENDRDVRMVEVKGTPDGEYVFVAGHNRGYPLATQALQIHNGIVKELYFADYLEPINDEDYGWITSVSVCGDTAYFVTLGGLWKYNYRDESSKLIKELDNYGYRDLHVQAPNDIFTVGGGFDHVHFNGISWEYNDSFYDLYDFSNKGASFKDNIIVKVGFYNYGGSGGAIIVRGIR